MKRITLIISMLLAMVLAAAACAAPDNTPSEQPESTETAPANQRFTLGISDNSDRNKNGTPTPLTLTFGDGTPGASTVVAKKGTPTIDGKDGDTAWGTASEVSLSSSVLAGGGPDKATVKAAYDDDNIYFLVKWQDPTGTENIHKSMWSYNAADSSWEKSKENEDRVYFLFNINATDFNAGCAVYCHVGNSDWDKSESKMGTNNAGETIDVWHWKATRGNPVDRADDKYWTDLTNAEEIIYDGETMVRTRLGDEGSGFASGNSEGDLPKYMHKDDPGANVDFLFDADKVAFDPDAGWSDGDTIPGYVVKEGAGSTADVTVKATYSGGTWVLEFQRSLITNNPDDVQFR